MAVSRERFEQGMTWAAYKEQMTRNRDRVESNEQTVQFAAEDLAFFKGLPGPINVLVLAEDWCGDVIANAPVLARLAEESGTLNPRFFLRDQNLDLIDQYLKEGQFRSIPVFVFFDQGFNELGYWIERPALMAERMSHMVGELFATDPLFEGLEPGTSPALLPDEARARLMRAHSEFRSGTREQSDREVVREIRSLIENALLPSD